MLQMPFTPEITHSSPLCSQTDDTRKDASLLQKPKVSENLSAPQLLGQIVQCERNSFSFPVNGESSILMVALVFKL